MAATVIESAGAEVPTRRQFTDPHTGSTHGISGRSRTPRSFATAIRPDVGEAEAYRQALLRGEIGLQRPMGVNVKGVDFVTAVRSGATSVKEVVCTDVKSSGRGRFPTPKQSIPGSWITEVQMAVNPTRLNLKVITADAALATTHGMPFPSTSADLKALEQEIVLAVQQNRIRLRQLNANYSPAGQGLITGW